MNTYNKKLIYEIKKYSSQGKLSVFVGAGVSRLSGFPSWNALVQSMADEIGYAYNSDSVGYALFSPDELLKIPQIYYVEKGKDVYRKKVEKDFQKDCRTNIIHDLIMSLKPHHILTTNYDTLLEQAACKFGRNFSVVNADHVVSKAETTNYILKVHGDFSEEFVLKEEDYLNYENNYVLIDKIMKTIFATNLVIFIGYGLNDYNIKLILNWVKNVQSDSFVKPIFISTGERLQDYELRYQEQRGIRVIDWNDFGTDEEYVRRYEVVLKGLLSYEEKWTSTDRKAILNYLYDKIAPLKYLAYLRRKDFNQIFQGEYILNDEWLIDNITMEYTWDFDNIKPHTHCKVGYIEDFFENEDVYKVVDTKKYLVVKEFFNKVLVCGIKKDDNLSNISLPKMDIKEESFNSRYADLYEFCKHEYGDNLENNYRKAYYLAQLGQYEESYQLYTTIIEDAKKNNEWIVYYFSQINRCYLYSIIKQMNQHLTGINGVSAFGKIIHLYSNDFLEKLDMEMTGFVLENQFDELPYEIKRKYSFLRDFSKRNCFIEAYYELVSDKYDVDKSRNSYTLSVGLSKFDKIKYTMLESEKFIRDNMLLFAEFNENKIFIKNAMTTWLEAYQKDITKSEHSIFGRFSNSRLDFTLNDIILISKNYKKDDINSLLSIINMKDIPFNETEQLEKYLMEQIDFYQKEFTRVLENKKILLWKLYGEELKNFLMLSAYFVKDSNCKYKAIEFVIKMPDSRFNVLERQRIINRWIRERDDEPAIKLLEEWMLFMCEDVLNEESLGKVVDLKVKDISAIARMIANLGNKVILNDVSEFVTKQKDKLSAFTNAINEIYHLLDIDARQIMDDEYQIKDALRLIYRVETCGLPKNCNEYDIIKKYMDDILEEKKQERQSGYTKVKVEPSDKTSIVARYMFLSNYPKSIIEKYKGISEEYDFLFYPESFDVEAFAVEWLVEYPDELCRRLAESEIHQKIIVEILHNAMISDSFGAHIKNRLFRVYRIMVGKMPESKY